MAEGVIRVMAANSGMSITVDSAGIGGWHTGNTPDSRGLKAALARGYDNRGQRARQVSAQDFHDFDLILGMDRSNVRELECMRPRIATAQVRLFHPDGLDIPDPYYGGPDGFDAVLDMIEQASGTLLAELTH